MKPTLFDKPHWKEDEDVLVEEDFDLNTPSFLVVFNDDVNSFDWVIDCFMEVLGHTNEQAEQLAMLIHFKGKATVKTAPRSVLEPLCSALLDRGLSAEIEGGDDDFE